MNPQLHAIGQELKKRLDPILRQPLNWQLIDRLSALQEQEQARARPSDGNAAGRDPPKT